MMDCALITFLQKKSYQNNQTVNRVRLKAIELHVWPHGTPRDMQLRSWSPNSR